MDARRLLRSTAHILGKDVRYLRVELCLTATTLIAFAGTHARYPDYPAWALFGVAAAYLIGRLVHAEPLPGGDHFWKTRPYPRMSLLSAKLSFVLLFVSLPLFLVQLGLFLSEGFSPLDHIPGILWTQALLFFAVVLPVTALAALTEGIHGYVAGMLASTVLLAWIWANLPAESLGWPHELDWTRYALLVALVAPAALVVLGLQFGGGHTRAARGLAIATSLAVLGLTSLLPVSLAMTMQSFFTAGSGADPSVVIVELEDSGRDAWALMLREGEIGVDLPITVKLADPALSFDLYRATATLEAEDGTRIASFFSTDPRGGPEQTARPYLRTRLPSRERDLYLQRPVKLHIAIDLAVWKETETYQAGRAPSFRVGDLYCTIGRDAPEDRLELLTCRSPLRWPSGWMTTDYPDGRLRNFQGSMATLREATRANYSPLPAALDLNNVEMEISGREPSDDPGPIHFVLSEPVAFVTKEFEATVDLADYLVE